MTGKEVALIVAHRANIPPTIASEARASRTKAGASRVATYVRMFG